MLRILRTTSDPPETIRAALTQASFLDRTVEEAGGRAILDDVRARGDAAVREVVERFDGVRLEQFEVSEAETRAARGSECGVPGGGSGGYGGCGGCGGS